MSIQITDLTSDGRGVGRLLSGQVVFVEGALPGDSVNINFDPISDNSPATGIVGSFKEESPDRIEHPCSHHKEGCPSCPLGAMKSKAGHQWKLQHLKQVLSRIGNLNNQNIRPILTPEPFWGYRDRIELKMAVWNGKLTPCYMKRNGSPLPIKKCLLAAKPIQNTMEHLFESATETNALQRNTDVKLLLRDNGQGATVAVLFIISPFTDFQGIESLQTWLNGTDLAGWEIHHTTSMAQRFMNSKILASEGDVTINTEIEGKAITLPSTAFTQTHRSGSSLLVETALKHVPENNPFVDLYGGYGAFGLRHAISGSPALILEASAETVRAGRKFAKDNDLDVTFLRRDLGRLSVDEFAFEKDDVVLLDPPRSGAHDRLLKGLERSKPKKVIYVSCHPAALARDLKKLKSYEPELFVPIDLFPQTTDIEVVTVLNRIGALEP